MLGGEIFAPKIASYRITDLAEAISPDCGRRIAEIRPGENIHEEMITRSHSYNTLDLEQYFAIVSSTVRHSLEGYCANKGGSAKFMSAFFRKNPNAIYIDMVASL